MITTAAKPGFTIIELLIFMGILASFLGILTQIFHTAIDTELESAATSAVNMGAEYLITRLQHDIRRADSIVTPAAPGDTSSSMILITGGLQYTYAVSAGRLELTTVSGTDSLTDIGSTVTDFTVTRLGPATGKNSLRVGFTLTSVTTTTSGASQTRDVIFTAALR